MGKREFITINYKLSLWRELECDGSFLQGLCHTQPSVRCSLCLVLVLSTDRSEQPLQHQSCTSSSRKCPSTRCLWMSGNRSTLHKNEHTASVSPLINKSAVLKNGCYLNSHLLYEFLGFTGWISGNLWLLCCRYENNQKNQSSVLPIFSLGLEIPIGRKSRFCPKMQ